MKGILNMKQQLRKIIKQLIIIQKEFQISNHS